MIQILTQARCLSHDVSVWRKCNIPVMVIGILVPGNSHLLSLTAFSVYRSGQKVRGRGLIYRYSVASGPTVVTARPRPAHQPSVPEGPELAGLGQVGVHHPQAVRQLCV